MAPIRLPHTESIFNHRPYSAGVIDSLFELVKGQTGPSGWVLAAEDATRHVFLFILQNSPYAAAQFAQNRFKTLSLRDYFQTLASQNRSHLTLLAVNPVLFKCLLVLTQKIPTTTGTTDLVNIESLLQQIKSADREAVVSLQRGDELNLFFFLNGALREAFFADPASVSKDSGPEDQLLEYAYGGKPTDPAIVQAYYDVQVAAAEDSDLAWQEWSGGIVEYFLRPRPELVFLDNRESVEKKVITKSLFTLGRQQECDLTLQDTLASRVHAVIREAKGRFVLEDQKSRNGTWINGKKVSTLTLADGDEIRIGECRIMFVEKSQEPPKTEDPASDRLDTTVMKLDDALLDDALLEEAVDALEIKTADGPVPLGLEMVEGHAVGTRYPLKDKTIIGRTKTDINTNDPKTSRHHAVVERKEDGYHFIDLKSTNGSFINDREVHAQRLVPGDRIKLGDTAFLVVEVAP